MQEKLSEVTLILVGSTFVILTLTGLVVISLFINQKRKFRYRQELANMRNSYEREVLKTQLETQSLTFQSISRELHDNVGTLISIALVHLHTVPFETRKMEEVTNLLSEAMDTLRDISRSINPERISRMGLRNALGEELEKIRKTNLFKTTFETAGEEFAIDPQQQIILFRIVQEALNNALKHSGGDSLSLKMIFQDNCLSITLCDNGRGFNQKSEFNTSGLLNMKKRAELIKADLTIESHAERGTCLRINYSDSKNRKE